MIHDFAITDRDVVFWEFPVLFGVEGPAHRACPYVWNPRTASRLGVMPLGGPASAIRWVEIDPCYVFHGINAYRDGDDVVLDVCRLDKVFVPGRDVITARADHAAPLAHRHGRRRHSRSRTRRRPTSRWTCRRHDRRHTGRAVPPRLVHDDVATTEPWGFEFWGSATWTCSTGRDRAVGTRAARAGRRGVLRARRGGERARAGSSPTPTTARSTAATSHVLDAQHVAAGPVARVHLPVRVPYGFHGLWVADSRNWRARGCQGPLTRQKRGWGKAKGSTCV